MRKCENAGENEWMMVEATTEKYSETENPSGRARPCR